MAPAKGGEAAGKGGSLLSSISGAVKTATRAVKTAMTLDDSAESAAALLRPWLLPAAGPPPLPRVRAIARYAASL